jgi:hypothetical protein
VQINHPDAAPDYYALAGSVRGRAHHNVVLLTGDEERPDNFRVRYGENSVGDDDRGSPRHRHNFDQIRYPIRGEHPIAPDEVIPEGWVGYFPEGTFYGPYDAPTDALTMLVLQFGGPSGWGYASVAQNRKGYDALIARGGVFEDGYYTWVDENGKRHAQDAFEAKWEAIYERPVAYPPARFARFLTMNPASFAWIADPDTPGVAHKRLGTFTERDVKIGFVQIDRGATFTFGREPAAEILFLQQGSVAAHGTEHATLTAFATAAADGPETVTATEDAEFFYVKLPTF